MKKRGFGAGRWNGAGGKVEADETFEQATIRECQEEFGVTTKKLEIVADIKFEAFHKDAPMKLDVRVFKSSQWEGEPRETEEMAPKWFDLTEVPYKDMWKDDIYWLPIVLKGKKVKAKFCFDQKDNMISKQIEEVESINE